MIFNKVSQRYFSKMNSDRINLLKQFMQEEPSNPFNKYALAMEYYEEKPQESLSLLRSPPVNSSGIPAIILQNSTSTLGKRVMG